MADLFLRFCILAFVITAQFVHGSTPIESNPVIATLRNGDIVEGFHVVTKNSSAHASVFLGVPYAEPPVGELRFRKTRPIPNRRRQHRNETNPTNRISALKYKPSCWQNHTHVGKPISDLSENCLYLNIFAGVECGNERGVGTKCPVLYYIHGGAYEFDSPVIFPVDMLVENFASRGLVMVTVAYRLGPLGFWTIGGEEAVGNYGMYDIIEGLKWVKREIEAFGGDPDQVTIMGHSSGATQVGLLTLSPAAEGLFQAAIMMSGSSSSALSTDFSDYRRLAVDLGCATSGDDEPGWRETINEKAVVDCMRRVPADSLMNLYWTYEAVMGVGHIKPTFDGPGGLFPRTVPELMRVRPPVDLMTGTTINEAGYDRSAYLDASEQSVSQLCKSAIRLKSVVKNERLLVKQCENMYVGSGLEEEQAIENLTTTDDQSSREFSIWTDQTARLLDDLAYHAPVFHEATSVAKTGGNVYLYSFNYSKRGFESVSPWHAFDLTFLMGEGTFPFELDDRDYAIKAIYVPLFVNFAKFRNPTPPTFTNSNNNNSGNASFQYETWIPLRMPPIDMNYYSIDLPEPTMKDGYHYEAVLFWDYTVPVVGGLQDTPSVADKPFVRAVAFASNDEMVKERTSTISETNRVDWRLAFWVIFGVMLLMLVSAGSVIFLLHIRRSVRAAPFDRLGENQALLVVPISTSSYSYDTFSNERVVL